MKQFPICPPSSYSADDVAFIVPRVLELTYTAQDLNGWAEDIWDSLDGEGRLELLKRRHRSGTGYLGPGAVELEQTPFSPHLLPPFPFEPSERALVRAELDARYARLYGLTRDELRYILDPAEALGEDYPSETFRVLKSNELREFGEYRARRLVLEAWDRNEHNLER
ncbi:hypothetical protein LJC14_05675 [Treponema sp. OttesenSCG-928-L16]|nr:hypothetical protein [Treponema sp. OttesenSCG-928-L16]